MWADWEWPKGKENNVFQIHFHSLLIGQHPAGGRKHVVRTLGAGINQGISILSSLFRVCGIKTELRFLPGYSEKFIS